jgi:hypothetical protein
MSQSAGGGGGREQRTAPRVDCQIPAELEVDGRSVATTLRDISATGAAVDLDATVALGQVFKIAFELPGDGGAVDCVGLVRGWRPGPIGKLVGLEFHNLAPASRRGVATYVRWVISGQDVEEARTHWSQSEPGSAQLVDPAEHGARKTLRWAPGFAAVVDEIAAHLADNDRVFVPVDHHGLGEGEGIWLELVPPRSHVLFRTLAEVTWLETGAGGGVSLRLAGLTELDRHVLRAIRSWIQQEQERYR